MLVLLQSWTKLSLIVMILCMCDKFLLLSNISSIHSQVNHARSQKLLVCP